jgi:hypothetical protein
MLRAPRRPAMPGHAVREGAALWRREKGCCSAQLANCRAPGPLAAELAGPGCAGSATAPWVLPHPQGARGGGRRGGVNRLSAYAPIPSYLCVAVLPSP